MTLWGVLDEKEGRRRAGRSGERHLLSNSIAHVSYQACGGGQEQRVERSSKGLSWMVLSSGCCACAFIGACNPHHATRNKSQPLWSSGQFRHRPCWKGQWYCARALLVLKHRTFLPDFADSGEHFQPDHKNKHRWPCHIPCCLGYCVRGERNERSI